MREIFPQKSVGDPLEASHVNRLSMVARRVASGVISVGMNGNDGFLSPPPLFAMTTVVVTSGSSTLMGTEEEDEDGNDPNQVKVRPQYWHTKDEDDDEDKDEWRERDDENEYDLDVRAVNARAEKGDVLHCYWHPQREQYLSVPPDRQNTVIPIRNDSGVDLRKYDVVGIEGIINLPPTDGGEPVDPIESVTDIQKLGRFQDQICFKGVTANDSGDSDEGKYEGKFAIVQSNIAINEIGWAVISGLTLARISLVDASHEFADVEVDEDVTPAGDIVYEDRQEDDDGDPWPVIPLKSSTSGNFKILWKEKDEKTDEGEWIWALGVVGASAGDEHRKARLKAQLNASGTADATLYDWTLEGGFQLTEEIVEVRMDILDSGEAIKVNSDIWIKKAYGVWWFDDGKCSILV